MYQSKHLFKVLLSMLLSIGLVSSIQAESAKQSDSATEAEIAGELYLPTDNPKAAVASVVQTAKQNDKLALVIMGANWCHDSRGLASRFHQEPMKSLIAQNYETIFVDVGYLNLDKEVIESLGAPVFYATPTVLIIDPVSGQLVNDDNRHQWANAYSISMEDTVGYFQEMSEVDLEPLRAGEMLDPDLRVLLLEIDSFEQQQADRLYQAYALLGPMMKKYKEGDKDAISDVMWDEVRDFRYKVPQDVNKLRAEAREKVLAGEDTVVLLYPEYPAFSWETEAP